MSNAHDAKPSGGEKTNNRRGDRENPHAPECTCIGCIAADYLAPRGNTEPPKPRRAETPDATTNKPDWVKGNHWSSDGTGHVSIDGNTGKLFDITPKSEPDELEPANSAYSRPVLPDVRLDISGYTKEQVGQIDEWSYYFEKGMVEQSRKAVIAAMTDLRAKSEDRDADLTWNELDDYYQDLITEQVKRYTK